MNDNLRKRISIGWNGRLETLAVFVRYRDVIHDVYFAPPDTPSGRNSAATRQADYAARLDEFLHGLSSEGLSANLLLNGLCAGELTGSRQWARQAVATVQRYAERGASHVTCASVTDMLLVRRHFPQLCIHASVNLLLDCPGKCAQLRHVCDVITLDRSLNYDLKQIAEIRRLLPGKRLKILVNEGCLSGCVHRVQHFNALAHNRNLQTGYCKFLFARHPELILQTPFVRPEDLRHYFGLVDYFKIASRDRRSAAHVALLLEAYSECSYRGNLFDLVSSDGIAAVMAMGIPLFLENSQIAEDFFSRRAATRGRWIPEDPIQPDYVFPRRLSIRQSTSPGKTT